MTATTASAPLLGREHHLAALEDALAAARRGRAVTALVHGAAGAGKTALCRRFLDGLEGRGARAVEARCRPRSAVPHATLAPLVHALADLELPESGEREALARLFPTVLRGASADGLDPFEIRRRGALGLRAWLAAAVPPGDVLVVVLDDLQAGDADSASLLLDALTPPAAVPLLLVLAYRSEAARTTHLAAALLRRLGRGEPVGDLREILVAPLSSPDARRLAGQVLGGDASDEAVRALARDSGGVPGRITAALGVEGAPPEEAPSSAEALGAARAHERALAFHAAADLYRRSLDGAAEPGPIRVALAHALARAGRSAEAAGAYLDAAAAVDPPLALDLRRRAAELAVCAGRIEEGLAGVRDLLAAVDLELPASPARAYASLLVSRARLSLRGLDGPPRAAPTPEALLRVDVCWSVGNALHGLDAVRAAHLQARHLLHALDAGDPYRLARALAHEAIDAAATGGRRGLLRAARLLDRAQETAERSEHPHALAWAAAATAAVRFHEARFADAVALADHAVRLLRGSGGEVTWELGAIVGRWLLPALWWLGRPDELAARLPAHLAETEARGALAAQATLRALALPRLMLAGDRPGEAQREAEGALASWSAEGIGAQAWSAIVARALVALYDGDGPRAHAELDARWPALDASAWLRVESARVETLHLRGQCALAALPAEGAAAIAERAARSLARAADPTARPFSRALQAGVALAHGQVARALGLLEEAERGFGELSLGLLAAAARRRRGEVAGGAAGSLLCESADAWMFARGVERPDRMAAALVTLPGG